MLEDGDRGGRSLAVESQSDGAAVRCALSAAQLKGCAIRVSALVKARGVSPRPNSWNGIKLMLAVETPAGKQWPQAQIDTGTFDWVPISFFTRVPVDATNLHLVMGLERVSGKVWFDDLKVTVVRKWSEPPRAQSLGAVYKGHNLARLRGVMISPNIDAEGLRVLGQDWKANLIRWQLIRQARPEQVIAPADYDVWLEAELKRLERALPLCERYGLLVAVDLHSPPGGRGSAGGYVAANAGLFSEPESQAKLVRIWRQMAARFKGQKAIWGYDLVNEPVEDALSDDCGDWQGLAQRVAEAIRQVDPDRAIIVEPASWGGPEGLASLQPLPVSNLVYSVHMYIPHAFTHQGVFGKSDACSYPGQIQGELWNKARLERALQPVISFQQRYGVHVYIGEFSAIRWAPDNSAARYLKDLIEIFESHGWDWSYHAFREWQGWSVELGTEREDLRLPATPSERQQLLQGWFGKNQKPG
jgi:hypothetical protein